MSVPPVRAIGPVGMLRGHTRLVFDAVMRMTDLVEAMHHNIARHPLPFEKLDEAPAPGIAGLVYRSIRGVTSVSGSGVDAALALTQPLIRAESEPPAIEAWRAAVNGVLGDHLAATENPLAIPMQFRYQGKTLKPDWAHLSDAVPNAKGKLLIVLHGLCMNDRQWNRNGHDHARELARKLGYTPVYLLYNSGLHISTNGRSLAVLLEQLVREWPAKLGSVDILAHSMGGLVARSALHYASADGAQWLRRVRNLVFLGTPHHGAPLERHGNRFQRWHEISPYIAPLARLGMIRSAGITDLRYGSLLDDDWQGKDRFAPDDDARQFVPLPDGVRAFAAAATLGKREGDAKDRWLADGLVPLYSALGQHRDPQRRLDFPRERQWVGHEMSHWDLLDNKALYAQIRQWLK